MAQSSLSINGMLDLGVFRGFDGVNQVGTVQRSNLAISGYENLGGGDEGGDAPEHPHGTG